MKLLFLLPLVATAGCRQVEECGASAIERMPTVKFEAVTPAACAKPCGDAKVWDFTAGLPAGGKLRKGGRLAAEGLHASDVTNMVIASGYMFDKLWTPPGAFLFAAEFVPGTLGGPGAPPHEGILWDDLAITYVPKRTNRGFQLALSARGGEWTPILWTGFSNDTVRVPGPAVRLTPGKPAKIAFYFGADGHVVWDFEGRCRDVPIELSRPLAPSVRNKPVIGDRVCSYYHPFNGVIRRVSITPCRTRAIGVTTVGRCAFRRGESPAAVRLKVRNTSKGRLSGASAFVEQFVEEGRARKANIVLGDLSAGAETEAPCAVETRLRPGWHALRVTVTGRWDDGTEARDVSVFRVGIGPCLADRMTALMWGFDAPVSTLADLGFSHGLKYMMPGDLSSLGVYDEALVAGIGITHSMRVVFPDGKDGDPAYMRQDRTGKVVEFGKKRKGIEISNPEFLGAVKPIVEKNVSLYGDHPAFTGVLPCSELRDQTFPSFTTEHLRYRKETGKEVPAEVSRKTIHVSKLNDFKKRFPDGVVPKDDPVLSYYRWFWKGGDGWPAYTGGIADIYRKGISRPDFFVFWDPAVRCPPIWGSGGAVDMLNQWVYAVPEPMNVAGPAEEILAMSKGRPGQKPAIMTQLICYRAQIAPMGKVVSPEPEWVRRRPKADFPTIPPDTLQEATWSMIAKPMQAIMYHGWGTIYETGRETGYVYTNPESTDRIRHLLKDVVVPLGPMLKRLGREAPPVAVLESFTTCALGGPASWGWKAPSITFMQRARLDPRVVYEETILRDGLDGVKVLYAPQCIFLMPDVVAKIKEFQARGGTLVADEQLLKALKADVTVPVVSFSPPPASDHTEEVNEMEAAREGDAKTRKGTLRAKATMVAQANDLRQRLAARFTPEADSSSPEIVTYSRRWNNTRYVFAINDHRTFGDYVGPWGLTMEKGLPYEGEVSLADDEGAVKAVYELSRGGEVPFTRTGGRIKVSVKYATNDGRLLAFLNTRIASVKVEAPTQVRGGGAVRVTFSVQDAAGKPIDALLPAEIRLLDAAGRELDGAGWVCLQGGTCTVDILTNLNDVEGNYTLVCRDRASGLSDTRTIRRIK